MKTKRKIGKKLKFGTTKIVMNFQLEKERNEINMEIAKWILVVIYFIVALALIILALLQSKEDSGLSSTITGSSTNNFFEKNKSRTKEGKQKRWTVILSIIFAILTIVLGIIYMA